MKPRIENQILSQMALVGRVTPCAPPWCLPSSARRGLTRPTSGRCCQRSASIFRHLPLLTLIGAISLFLLNVHAAETKTLYTCGMHPQVIQDHPGNCPICGMKLTPIRKGDGVDTNAANSSAIKIDPVTIQNMNLKTTQITRGPLRKMIRTVGTIDYNETALAEVTTKFRGWIEKLNVDATGQLVHRGEPLFEVYSPELYSAQTEYLLALNQTGTNSGANLMREIAVNKLKFYDISDAQIAELAKTHQVRKTLQVDAPMDGFVIEKMAVQGQMVDAGMKLYRIADLGIVWVLAQIYEQDLPFIQLGQEAIVRLSSLPDREFRGRVTFVYPSVDEKTRTVRVRLEFENPGYFLKPGMFVSVHISAELDPSALLIPDSAVLRSGAKNTVFVALDGGKFDARTVMLGAESEDGLLQVLGGLSEGERVVTSGQFMLDSESQLNEAIEKMRGGSRSGETAGEPNPGTNFPTAEGSRGRSPHLFESGADTVVYVCPMPEHVSIIYDHAGKCPICNMALVPVSESALKKIQPGGKVLYYTCPMPEHASVHESKPGKCPLCAMTLIPVMAAPGSVGVPPAISSPTDTRRRDAGGPREQLYFCPMHPTVVSNAPGKCPECEMDLVPKEK
jgi:Cu(I)/Ag(I) efflux system membrane fusion protein